MAVAGNPRQGYKTKRSRGVRSLSFHTQRLLYTMLRNERVWFPRFKNLCKQTLQYKNPFHPDHMTMVKVVECVSYRQVESVVRDCASDWSWLLRLLRRLRARTRLFVSLTKEDRGTLPFISARQEEAR